MDIEFSVFDPGSKEDDMNQAFQRLVTEELAAARKAHRKPLNSPHEAYAVIREEVDELWDECRKKRSDPARMVEELVQIAAMAQRAAEDLFADELDPDYRPPLRVAMVS